MLTTTNRRMTHVHTERSGQAWHNHQLWAIKMLHWFQLELSMLAKPLALTTTHPQVMIYTNVTCFILVNQYNHHLIR